MSKIDQDKIWSKIFGTQIPSHTFPGTFYTVALTSEGWTCTCMDFRLRHGSYQIRFDEQLFHGCKHIIDHLRNLAKTDRDTNNQTHKIKSRKEGSEWWTKVLI